MNYYGNTTDPTAREDAELQQFIDQWMENNTKQGRGKTKARTPTWGGDHWWSKAQQGGQAAAWPQQQSRKRSEPGSAQSGHSAQWNQEQWSRPHQGQGAHWSHKPESGTSWNAAPPPQPYGPSHGQRQTRDKKGGTSRQTRKYTNAKGSNAPLPTGTFNNHSGTRTTTRCRAPISL